jgi:hypothetical protein
LRYKNKQILASLALGIILLFGIFSTAITSPPSYLYAQQQQQQQLQNGATTPSSLTAVGVKITSPARGQQVPVGSLTISGTSKNNANSNDCTVYAIWDHLKPYQKVEPTGPSGTDDYSNWTFTYTSTYHLITNGTNQLTAKISCLASPSSSTTVSSSNLTKWYSINVTGMPINQTSNTASIAASSNITTTAEQPLSPSLLIPLPVPSTTVDTDSNSGGHNRGGSSKGGGGDGDGGNNNKELSISIKVDKDPIVRGNDQTITVTVSDAKSHEKIGGASVEGSVKYVTSHKEPLSGSTYNDGYYEYTWRISGNAKPGTFTVKVDVSADGYKSGSETADFKVIKAPSSNQSSLSNKKVVPDITASDKDSDKDNPDNNNDTTTTTTSDGVDNSIGTNPNPVTDENNDKIVDNSKDNDGSKPDNPPVTHTTDDQNNNLAHDENKKDGDKDKDKSKSPLHDGDDNKKKEIKKKEKNKDVKPKVKIKNPKKKIKP